MWSPWRSKHINRSPVIEKQTEESSIFTRLAAENRDEANLILWRGRFVFVIMNLHPYNNGHLMIIPYREVSNYEDLSLEEQVELAASIERCIRWLKHALQPDGFNVGMNLGKAGGAGIPQHLHMHIVPRWSGDTNFMPTVAEVKVVPEALTDTYNKLLSTIAAFE